MPLMAHTNTWFAAIGLTFLVFAVMSIMRAEIKQLAAEAIRSEIELMCFCRTEK